MTAAEPSLARPVAAFAVEPPEPSAGQLVRLLDLSYDPGGKGIALHGWDLGDGTTSTEPSPEHRYEKDGTYEVTLHVTAADGRMGVGSALVQVSSHDVAVTKIVAPDVVTVADAREVIVAVGSRHGHEIVQVELLRSRGVGKPDSVSVRTRSLPESGELEIGFPVTFDDLDAEHGEVTFRARAAVVGAADLRPEDNELTAPPTVVVRRIPAPWGSSMSRGLGDG
jgi:hypothetical protein